MISCCFSLRTMMLTDRAYKRSVRHIVKLVKIKCRIRLKSEFILQFTDPSQTRFTNILFHYDYGCHKQFHKSTA